MIRSQWSALALGAAMFAAGFGVRNFMGGEVAHAQSATRVFEMRTYTAAPGKLDALQTRFRDHTLRIFEKHGMQNIGYWIPADPPNSESTIVYIIAHKDRESAKKSWAAFRCRSRVAEGQDRVAEGWQPDHQDRIGLPEPDGLLTDQVRGRREKGARQNA